MAIYDVDQAGNVLCTYTDTSKAVSRSVSPDYSFFSFQQF